MENCANVWQQTGLLLNKPFKIVVSCEHGGSRIPREYRYLFKGLGKRLGSHKGFDPGSHVIAKNIAKALNASFYYSTISRLLADLNRSPRHPKLHSEIIRRLSCTDKSNILAHYYYPYRNALETFIADNIRSGKVVLHISVHTFTPVIHGIKRNADVGLLYDPSANRERELCVRWQKAFSTVPPDIIVRRNYPYLGKTDGLATYLRKQYPPEQYLGIELEVNQKYPLGDRRTWKNLQGKIIMTIESVLFPRTEQRS